MVHARHVLGVLAQLEGIPALGSGIAGAPAVSIIGMLVDESADE